VRPVEFLQFAQSEGISLLESYNRWRRPAPFGCHGVWAFCILCPSERGRRHDEGRGDELFYAYMVDNQAIFIPDTIDAMRALTGKVGDAAESIAKANATLGIGSLADMLGR
jgi:hypothetical protein